MVQKAVPPVGYPTQLTAPTLSNFGHAVHAVLPICLFIHVLSRLFYPTFLYTVQMQIYGPVYASNTYSIDVHIFIVLSMCVVEKAYAYHFDMDETL